MITRIDKVAVDWAFEQSHHASLKVEVLLGEKIDRGPGLTRIKASILENPASLLTVKAGLIEMLAQIPNEWDAHMRLEYLKMAIRTSVSMVVGSGRKEIRTDIEDLEKVLNEMKELMSQICAAVDEGERTFKGE